MNPINPSDLESRLRRAAELSRPPGSLVQSVMNAVAAEPPLQTSAELPTCKKGNWTMRIAIPTAVAACLTIAALLWLAPARRLSAQDQLQQAVAATTQAYQGWVHLAITVPPDAQSKAGPDTTELPRRMVEHGNAASGIYADVREYADGSDVTFYSVHQREQFTYDHKTNELRIATLTDTGLQGFRDGLMIPTTVDGFLQALQKAGRAPVSVNSAPDNDGTRFDVVMFASKADQNAFNTSSDTILPRTMTLWTNRSNLITRIQFEDSPQGSAVFETTYGKPEIHDIYDLGVPQSAKKIDLRLAPSETDPNSPFAKLKARLKDHIEKGFGDYTALLSQYDVNPDGTASANSGYVTLFSVQGPRWLVADYRLLSAARPGRGRAPGTVLTEPPSDWPTPDIEKLLPSLLKAPPLEFWQWDGKTGLAGTYDQNRRALTDVRPILAKEAPHMLPSIGLVDHCWPGATEFEGLAFGQATLLQDAAHPKLLGIHTHEDPDPRMGRTQTSETTTWFDPARDDLPTKFDSQSYEGKDPTAFPIRMQQRFTDFAQLPANKQWYPTHWQQTYSSKNPRTGQLDNSTTHFKLQILPTLKLPDEWFTDPRKRMETTPPAPDLP